jgi:type I restriction enzyme S subunit
MKYRLKDLCSINKGATGIMKADGGKYPLVALGEERKQHSEYQFDARAVIVPLISSTGHGHASMKRVHYQEGKFALGNILCAVIPNNEKLLHPKYLHLYLQQFKDILLVPLMKGAANVSLSMNKLADVEIEVPSLERQLEIIKLEEEVTEYKNELEERLIAQERDVIKLRQQLLQDAVQGKLVAQNPTDEPASELLKKIKAEKAKLISEKKLKKEKELPPIKPEEIPFEIPENWVWCRLGALRDVRYSLSYGVLVPGNDVTNGIPFIRVQDLDYADKNEMPIKHISPVIDKQYSKTRLVGGEILICVVGSIGKVALSSDSWIGANIARAVCRYMPNQNISRQFLFYCLTSPFIQNFFQEGKKSINPTLNVNVLETTLIPLPPLAEQTRIVQKLDELMQYCNELEASIKQSELQNEKLLQQVLREALRKEPVEA